MTQSAYEKSNQVLEVAYNKFSKNEFAALLKATEGVADRQRKAQKVLDYLCGKYGIPTAKVQVLDMPQRSMRSGTILGDYTYAFFRIRVYNKTAKQHKVVSIKGFADTLLHEFMHHYDVHYLKIDTLHTAGFYTRISDLKAKLEG